MKDLNGTQTSKNLNHDQQIKDSNNADDLQTNGQNGHQVKCGSSKAKLAPTEHMAITNGNANGKKPDRYYFEVSKKNLIES